MVQRDLYELLEIDRAATSEEIKRAYRRLAHQFHPDKNPGDTQSAEKMKELNEAYAILSDRNKRGLYDTYGHAEGDRVLQTIAGVLRGSLRKADIVGRYGGDEFMLILPETSLKGAEDFGERVRCAVENTRFGIAARTNLAVSLSLGVTSIEAGSKGININSLIKCADTALYASKRTGRNKVCVVRT